MSGARTLFHRGLAGLLMLAIGAPLTLARPSLAQPPPRNVGLISDATRQRVGFDAGDSAGLFVWRARSDSLAAAMPRWHS